MATRASVAAFQLDEPQVQKIGVAAANPERDGIDYAGSWGTRLALKA